MTEPSEQTRHRDTIADMCRAHIGNFRSLFNCLHERYRVGATDRLAATFGYKAIQRIDGGCLIQPHRFVFEGCDIFRELLWFTRIGEILKRVSHRIVEFIASDVERWTAFAWDQSKS